ncbi:MAG: hypothetical protein HYY16_07260 [Planctomycetes bacterium]|nr:hypothetical protein [Planctomycetota bacterium]
MKRFSSTRVFMKRFSGSLVAVALLLAIPAAARAQSEQASAEQADSAWRLGSAMTASVATDVVVSLLFPGAKWLRIPIAMAATAAAATGVDYWRGNRSGKSIALTAGTYSAAWPMGMVALATVAAMPGLGFIVKDPIIRIAGMAILGAMASEGMRRLLPEIFPGLKTQRGVKQTLDKLGGE